MHFDNLFKNFSFAKAKFTLMDDQELTILSLRHYVTDILKSFFKEKYEANV